MKKKRRPRALPAPLSSMRLLVSLPPDKVGLFRFLLEAHDNLASFTVLDRREALLKVLFSPHQEREVLQMLDGMGEVVPLSIRAWPPSSETVLPGSDSGTVCEKDSSCLSCKEDRQCPGSAPGREEAGPVSPRDRAADTVL